MNDTHRLVWGAAGLAACSYIATFYLASDRSRQRGNDLLVTCKADAPPPTPQEAMIVTEKVFWTWALYTMRATPGYVVTFKGCDVEQAFVACGTVSKPNVTKSLSGYVVTRPHTFCDFSYGLSSQHRQYRFSN